MKLQVDLKKTPPWNMRPLPPRSLARRERVETAMSGRLAAGRALDQHDPGGSCDGDDDDDAA